MNVEKIRRDFPILQMNTGGRPIIYMDSASMALKPRQVIEAMDDYYFNYPSALGVASISSTPAWRRQGSMLEKR